MNNRRSCKTNMIAAGVSQVLLLGVCLIFASLVFGQEGVPLFTKDLTPAEFAKRRSAVYDAIGANALAVLQDAPSPAGYTRFRQSNEFYYLSGIETVYATEMLSEHLARNARSAAKNTLFTPFSPAEGFATSRDLALRAISDMASDPWDGRPSREGHFVDLLRSRFPHFEIKNLTPILDQLRLIKSPAEIAPRPAVPKRTWGIGSAWQRTTSARTPGRCCPAWSSPSSK